MTVTRAMLDAAPHRSKISDELTACIEAAFACAEVCAACADACLHEPSVAELRRCISINSFCADLCATTGRLLSSSLRHDAAVWRLVVEACRVACEECADECAAHADHHEHCRICAETCRRCRDACTALLSAWRLSVGASPGAPVGQRP